MEDIQTKIQRKIENKEYVSKEELIEYATHMLSWFSPEERKAEKKMALYLIIGVCVTVLAIDYLDEKEIIFKKTGTTHEIVKPEDKWIFTK